MEKLIYLAPAVILLALILVFPTLAGQLTAYGVLAFAGYKGVKFALKRGKQ